MAVGGKVLTDCNAAGRSKARAKIQPHHVRRITVASKKKSSKKSSTNKSAGAARGHQYELTAKGKALKAEELRGQYAVVYGILKKKAHSVAEIAAIPNINKTLETKQDPKRPVAFILTQWKNKGLVTFAKPAKKEVAAAA